MAEFYNQEDDEPFNKDALEGRKTSQIITAVAAAISLVALAAASCQPRQVDAQNNGEPASICFGVDSIGQDNPIFPVNGSSVEAFALALIKSRGDNQTELYSYLGAIEGMNLGIIDLSNRTFKNLDDYSGIYVPSSC